MILLTSFKNYTESIRGFPKLKLKWITTLKIVGNSIKTSFSFLKMLKAVQRCYILTRLITKKDRFDYVQVEMSMQGKETNN